MHRVVVALVVMMGCASPERPAAPPLAPVLETSVRTTGDAAIDDSITPLVYVPPPYELPPPADPIIDLGPYGSVGTCATHRSGRVHCWGGDVEEPSLIDVDDALAVRGTDRQCIIRQAGIECAFDDRPYLVTGVPDPIDVTTGVPVVALDKHGRLWRWTDEQPTPKLVAGIADATAIATTPDDDLTCAVHVTGAISCTDSQPPFRWRPVAKVSRVRLLAFGFSYVDTDTYQVVSPVACAVTRDDDVRCFLVKRSRRGGLVADYERVWPHPRHHEVYRLSGATALSAHAAIVNGRVVVIRSDRIETLPQIEDAVAITDDCALRKQGSVVCWGDNEHHRTGQPYRSSSATPLPVVGLPPVVAITNSTPRGWAIARDGRAFTWGGGSTAAAVVDSKLVGPNVRAVASIAALDSLPCFVRADRSVVCLTGSPNPVEIAGATDVVELVAGSDAFTARRRDGSIVRWSTNDILNRRPARLVAGLTGIQVAGDFYLVCARDAAGDVACVEQRCAAGCVDLLPRQQALGHVVEIVAWGGLVCARREDSTVACAAASNIRSRTGHAAAALPIPAGVDEIDDAIALGADDNGFCIARKTGALACWGARTGPAGLQTILADRSLAGPFVGGRDGCAIVDRRAKCWGANTRGRLGDGSKPWQDTPAAVPGL